MRARGVKFQVVRRTHLLLSFAGTSEISMFNPIFCFLWHNLRSFTSESKNIKTSNELKLYTFIDPFAEYNIFSCFSSSYTIQLKSFIKQLNYNLQPEHNTIK